MKPLRLLGLAAWISAAGLCMLCGAGEGKPDSAAAENAPATAEGQGRPAPAPLTQDIKTTKHKGSKFAAYLPPYYDEVVSDKQRAKILAIEDEYGPKIAALRTQLTALIKEQNEKMAAVLTVQQQEKIVQLRAAATPKRPRTRPPDSAKRTGTQSVK